MQYVIDTHALIWFLENNSRLGDRAKQVLENPESKLILPAIALAEAFFIVEKGRTSIPNVKDLQTAVSADPRITVYPLDRSVVELTNNLLMINEMHDRQIVATALALSHHGEDVCLLTCDRNITMSGVVAITW